MTQDAKMPWMSMTFWGGLIAAIPPFASLIGVDVTPDDLAGLEKGVEALISGIGMVLVFVGRVRASKKIGRPT